MNFKIIIGSTIYYSKDVEANSQEEAFEIANNRLASGEFTEWREIDADSFVYDVLGEV